MTASSEINFKIKNLGAPSNEFAEFLFLGALTLLQATDLSYDLLSPYLILSRLLPVSLSDIFLLRTLATRFVYLTILRQSSIGIASMQ
jgi:hypothetical protein